MRTTIPARDGKDDDDDVTSSLPSLPSAVHRRQTHTLQVGEIVSPCVMSSSSPSSNSGM